MRGMRGIARSDWMQRIILKLGWATSIPPTNKWLPKDTCGEEEGKHNKALGVIKIVSVEDIFSTFPL